MVMATTIKKGYKQTEIGVIPEDWDVKTIEQVTDCLDNLRVPLNESQRSKIQGDIPYCGANGVLDYVNNFVIDDDIILIAEDGGYFDEYAYRPIAYRMIGKSWVNNHAHILKAKDNFDQGFIYYSLVHKNILSFLAGGTRAKLNKSEMYKIEIGTPPTKSEQTAIVTVLSDTDALIEHLEKLIAKKKAIKQGMMQQLLTGKKRLPGFSGGWEVKKLGDLLYYEQPTKYLVKDTEYNDNNDTPVLTAGKTFILGYTNEVFGIFNNIPVIIFDDFTTANKFVTFPFKAKSSAMKMLMPTGEAVNLRFVYEKMQLIDFPLGEHKRYWISEYQNLEIEMPKPEEQTAIANILSDMDEKIKRIEQKRDKYKMLKQGMMQQLLTGKIRIYANN